MNRETLTQTVIERLAKEAGGMEYGPRTWNITFKRDALHRFADLIASFCEEFSTPIAAGGGEARLAALAKEYRPSMDAEVLHSWAAEIADTIRADTPDATKPFMFGVRDRKTGEAVFDEHCVAAESEQLIDDWDANLFEVVPLFASPPSDTEEKAPRTL
ncbi:hypothetical protein EJ076_00040 [Mesorhizobium sp. M7D.F.Ca.US.005.01.1.1]|uniref:hypothetical protein n=1 Tax=Mesorhizobium sp. M7D.F.Ca.US.005.01.1.1 TaxID=2493678 RepID=UPI000F75831A|nr:hypothetical protein [Mesorhizobium sp. M7D.F.Ca.US.005.01.1.1]AZO39694.1 hypothetical protein EJ076_00040 [Mesorhizobium sp. M7D.F.Ca.US.005.01.1.1]